MKNLLSLILIILSSYALSATDPRAAYNLVKEGRAVIFDVREKEEIKSGMVDKAVWFPKSKMESESNWKGDFTQLVNGKKIFLYCSSGKRSGECQSILNKNGIKSENIGGYEKLKTMLPTTIPKKI